MTLSAADSKDTPSNCYDIELVKWPLFGIGTVTLFLHSFGMSSSPNFIAYS